jgi:hypothetical protein
MEAQKAATPTVDAAEVGRELPPGFKIPSKTRCAKIMRQFFQEPRLHFARFGNDGLAVVSFMGTSQFHVVEIEPKHAEARELLHWYALVATFNAAGFDVVVATDKEGGGPRLEVVARSKAEEQKAAAPVACCERDTDADGNCDKHSAPGVDRVPGA